MLDGLRTFCEETMNDGAAAENRADMRKPPAETGGFHIFEKREREEIVWFCT